jgi:5'-3' exonuclease
MAAAYPAQFVPGPLLAVDAPSLLFRGFYALPDKITDDRKRPVNAILGATNLVLFEVERYRPRAVVMCFGPDAAPYRTELYSGYHADRAAAVPDGIVWQFEEAPGFYEKFGWRSLYDETVEADDLLGSLARIEEQAGGEALLLTGDRDMYQCATDKVSVLFVKTGSRGAEHVDPAEVRKRYGITPEQVPDFIALRGDPSDGLPGAKGIGEKTAADLLKRHGSLEGAIANWAGETPRVRAALHDQADELRDFREIATLRELDLERPPDLPLDKPGAAAAARALGMNRLAERLENLDV